MAVFRIPRQHVFPHPSLAEDSGLLGVGGDLEPARLLLAYQMGIFPWYSEPQPILWWSPDPRMVLEPAALRVSKSLRKRIRSGRYRVTLDRAFPAVIRHCATVPRAGQEGTWITPEMIEAYERLYRHGFAHSVEAWEGEDLVGGLYGVAVGRLFCGESMFALARDASKVAFVTLVRQLERWDYPLVDCQIHTDHLARFGARRVRRAEFIDRISRIVGDSGRRGPWRFDDDLVVGRGP